MKRFSGVRGTLILLVLIVGMVGYYYYLSNKVSKQTETDNTITQVQSVLLRDLELNYPSTPREVVRYFGDITLCLFSGSCEESDIDKLASKAIQLYDEELLENNPWAEYLQRLRQEVEEYREEGVVVSSYTPAGSTSVDPFTQDGYEWARFYCTFYMKKGKDSQVVNEIFLLRKDENRRWKIYGWDLAENVDTSAEDASGM